MEIFASMWVLDEFTFYIILLLSWIAVFVLTKKFGKRIPLPLNCWSCNKWSKIEFQNKNAWYCPRCDQYNGFTKDGSYNKELVETDDDCYSDEETQNNIEFSNGLCFACNQKLKMKTQQLADFIPSSDQNFDHEIENYKLSLEKLYDLCFKCKNHVRKTLHNQKSWLLRTQQFLIYKSLDKTQTWRHHITHFLNVLLCIFSLCDLFVTTSNIRLTILHEYYQLWFNYTNFSLFDFYGIKINLISYTLQMLTAIKSHNAYFSLYGGLSQLLIFIFNDHAIMQELCFCCPWLISIYLKNESFKDFSMINFAQITASLSLVLISFLKVKYGLKTNKNISTPKLSETFYQSSMNANQSNDITENNNLHSESLFEACQGGDLKKIFKEACHLNSPTPRSITPMFQHTFGEKPILLSTPNSNLPKESHDLPYKLNSPESLKIADELQTLKISMNGKRKNFKNNAFMAPRRYDEANVSEIFRSKPKIKLSPPRLHVKTYGGGYWKNSNLNDFSSNEPTVLSRSSSQSSGFGSQCPEALNHSNNSINSFTSSRESSICDDLDRVSTFSEPAYYLNSSFNLLSTNKPVQKPQENNPRNAYSTILPNDVRIIKPNIKNNCLVFSQRCYDNKSQVMFQHGHLWNGQQFISNPLNSSFSPISDTNSYGSPHLSSVYNFDNFSEGL